MNAWPPDDGTSRRRDIDLLKRLQLLADLLRNRKRALYGQRRFSFYLILIGVIKYAISYCYPHITMAEFNIVTIKI